MPLLSAVKKPVILGRQDDAPPSAPVDFAELADQIFRSVEQAMARRCSVLEARIAVLEKDAERRALTLTAFLRDPTTGELRASLPEKS